MSESDQWSAPWDDPKDWDDRAFAQPCLGAPDRRTDRPIDCWMDRLIERVRPAPGKRALDVAIGDGQVALALARGGAQVIAGDLVGARTADVTVDRGDEGEGTASARRPAQGRDSRGLHGGQGLPIARARIDGHRLPFAAGRLDIVTACHVLHYIGVGRGRFEEVVGCVREWARVTRPGGVIGVVVPLAPESREAADYVNALAKLRDPNHGWQYSLPEWIGCFEDAGLRIAHSEIVSRRLDLAEWSARRRRDADTTLRLRVLLRQAPKAVAEFLAPVVPDDGPHESVTFSHHDAILVGVVGASG